MLRFFMRLKCRLMPCLHQKAVEARETSAPLMRPTFLVFPKDPACACPDRQYMLGEARWWRRRSPRRGWAAESRRN